MAADQDQYSVDYSITITTHGRFRSKDPGVQFDELKNVIACLPNYVKCTIVGECHKDYTVHAHGIIRFIKNKMPSKYKRCFKKSLHDLFRGHLFVGHIKIDQITEHDTWLDYIKKDLTETYHALLRYPILRDDFNFFDLWIPFNTFEYEPE